MILKNKGTNNNNKYLYCKNGSVLKNSWYKPMCSNKTFQDYKSNSIHSKKAGRLIFKTKKVLKK